MEFPKEPFQARNESRTKTLEIGCHRHRSGWYLVEPVIFRLALNTAKIYSSGGSVGCLRQDQWGRGIQKSLADRVAYGFQRYGWNRLNPEGFSNSPQDNRQDGNKKNQEEETDNHHGKSALFCSGERPCNA